MAESGSDLGCGESVIGLDSFAVEEDVGCIGGTGRGRQQTVSIRPTGAGRSSYRSAKLSVCKPHIAFVNIDRYRQGLK